VRSGVFGAALARSSLGCVASAMLACSAVAAASAQGLPAADARGPLRRPARLEVRGAAVEAALQQLRVRSGVALAFSPTLLSGAGPVSCSCAGATVAQALDSILSGTGLEYLESGDRVILRPASRPPGDERLSSATPVRRSSGVLIVEVRGARDSLPVAGAEILVSGRVGSVLTDASGRGYLALAAGSYGLLVRALAFAPRQLRDIAVAMGEARTETLFLEAVPLELSEVVVTPGTYGVLREERITPQLAPTREEVQALPHFGEDIYRAVNRLPGITTANDVSAKFQIRGAPSDQTLVLLDGLALYEPFHLKDVDGVFSIIDVESVSEVELIAGGFPAQYGDRMGGVFTMQTATPTRTVTTLGASLSNLTFKSQGSVAGGRGAWLAAARRGFLDILLDITGVKEATSPRYYDAFAKVQYQLGTGHLLSAHVLHAGDDLSVRESDGTSLDSHWSSSYAWLSWRADFGAALSAQTVLSAGRVTRNRVAWDTGDEGERVLSVNDREEFDFLGLKQDWSLRVWPNWLVKWGFDARRGSAEYDYLRWSRTRLWNSTDPSAPLFTDVYDTVAVATEPEGRDVGLYVANRVRPVEPLTVELGMRYERLSYTGDGDLLAPRANLSLALTPRTTLRGAWGAYYQPQGLAELQVMDGDSAFCPAQRSEHRIVGLERRLADGLLLRVEAYQRRISHPRPEYRDPAPVPKPVPEEDACCDRMRVAPTRGRAGGIELLLKRDARGPVAWALGYALAVAEDEIGGRWVPRPQDQRHTVHAEIAWEPDPRWSLSWAWLYHSPWPTTEERLDLVTLIDGSRSVRRTWGPLNSGRLPSYHRMDLRVSRHIALGRGRLSVFLDVFNVYNRHNAVAIRNDDVRVTTGGQLEYTRVVEAPIGILPTIGARWDF